MVESVIYGVKLSSVGPGRVTGQDVVQELNNMDLAMKLHYLRAVYYFRREALEGLSVLNIKEPMFTWFNHFSATCGRFRRPHDSHSGGPGGRPFIKCNDCGARFIEAHSPYTLDECLQPLLLNHLHDHSLHNLLVSNQVIGPEIQFSPPVLLQFTWFKCGGVAVGLSWAHVLGDAFSAADFMNALGRVMAGHQLPPRPVKAQPQPQSRAGIDISRCPSPPTDPLSVKRVGPVGDHWICPNHNNNTRAKMEAFSLHLTAAQMEQLQSKVGGGDRIPFFEALCAVIWKCVAKTRTRRKDGDVAEEPKVVTICKNSRGRRQNENGGGGGGVVILSNAQGIGVVKADEDVSIAEAKPKQLAELLMMMIGEESLEDERSKIEEAMEREGGLGDFVVYGANLTFVDLEEADLYGLELKGQRPVYATYSIDGVGDQGAVLVLPGPQETGAGGGIGKGKGKVVTLIMPDTEVVDLKSDLLTELF
ncbi:protein ECERIFERUM 26-like [Diospyros lotus]|uniref:protein ECERIFERUM 26-like n=1 Tax=Diospyros lotus TaxID=55363 RepID=UPI0022588BDE|nr:protein ECERIFERUM 26-like [Diospyros lotus]